MHLLCPDFSLLPADLPFLLELSLQDYAHLMYLLGPSTGFVVARAGHPFFIIGGVSAGGLVVMRKRLPVVDTALLGDDLAPLADGFFFGRILQGKAQPV